MSNMEKKRISSAARWIPRVPLSKKSHFFCIHFPSAHLAFFYFRQLSPIFPRIPLDSPQRTGVNLLHPAELCILYVWAEAAITIEIVRARELNFSTQEKMSHTPTQSTASLVARCWWRNGHLCLFSALSLHVSRLVEDEEPRKKKLFPFKSERVQTNKRL